MTSSILLVRHGRTALNAEGRLRGLADPELDVVGVAEAHATAEALRPYGIGRVLSSPLQRAVATARIIAEASGVENAADAGVNDRDYGPWTGHVKDEVVAEWGSVDDAPGVEPTGAVLERATAVLEGLAGEAGAAPVAIVTHDAVIRPLLRSIDPDADPAVPTGSWAELARAEGGWRIVSVDNVPEA